MSQQTLLDSRTVNHPGTRHDPCTGCDVRTSCITGPAMETLGKEELPGFSRNRIHLAAGEHLYWRDDAFHALFVVASGSLKSYNVDLDGNERVRGFHYPGGMIGFDGIEGGRYRCHVEAMEDVSVCVLPFNQLLALSLHVPNLQAGLFRRLSRDLVHAETLAGDYPADVRLATFLLEIAGAEDSVRLPMARRDIANYLRLATETVSRLMTRFRTSGLIRCRGRFVTIVDADGLREIAEPALSN